MAFGPSSRKGQYQLFEPDPIPAMDRTPDLRARFGGPFLKKSKIFKNNRHGQCVHLTKKYFWQKRKVLSNTFKNSLHWVMYIFRFGLQTRIFDFSDPKFQLGYLRTDFAQIFFWTERGRFAATFVKTTSPYHSRLQTFRVGNGRHKRQLEGGCRYLCVVKHSIA